MISIASERNSVQIDAIEETKVNQKINKNQEKDTLRAENIHIANETINENNSQNENTNQNQTIIINKYIYPEFEGHAGHRYLVSIIRKIAPAAHKRTWEIADGFQAPGQECYVSVPRIMEEAGLGERKIYLDLRAMERRGWLVQRRVRKDFMNQEGMMVTRAVTTKDFTGLYHAAHDYHLWRTSREYLAPERENLSLILQDKALMRRLIKFENYRRLMVCAKPGRKSQEEEDYYEEQLAKAEERGTDVQELNQYSNTLTNTDSLYRRVITEENLTTSMDPNLSTAGREKDVGPPTIRKTQNEEDIQTNKDQKPITEEQTLSKPKSPPISEGKGAAAAKRVKRVNGYTEEELKQDTQKRGAAAAGIPAEHHHKLNGGLDQKEEQEQQQRTAQSEPAPRPRREIPAQLVQEITQFAQQYDSAHLVASDVTRAAKIYFTAAQTLEYFQDTLFWAFFDEAMEAAKKLRGCEHTNAKGRVNRIPYFFTCLENAFVFSLEELVYLRSDEPLYSEIEVWDMIDYLRKTYQLQRQSGQTQLDYRSWLEQILNQQEHRKQPKSHKNITAKDY
jgi:hypothetical protein